MSMFILLSLLTLLSFAIFAKQGDLSWSRSELIGTARVSCSVVSGIVLLICIIWHLQLNFNPQKLSDSQKQELKTEIEALETKRELLFTHLDGVPFDIQYKLNSVFLQGVKEREYNLYDYQYNKDIRDIESWKSFTGFDSLSGLLAYWILIGFLSWAFYGRAYRIKTGWETFKSYRLSKKPVWEVHPFIGAWAPDDVLILTDGNSQVKYVSFRKNEIWCLNKWNETIKLNPSQVLKNRTFETERFAKHLISEEDSNTDVLVQKSKFTTL